MVSRLVLDNATYLLEHLARLKQLQVVTPATTSRHAGIVTFRNREVDAATLWQYLTERGVVCAARGGGIRLSPHFYNKKADLDAVIKLISDYKSA